MGGERAKAKLLGKILESVVLLFWKKRGEREKAKLLGNFLEQHIICRFGGGGKRSGAERAKSKLLMGEILESVCFLFWKKQGVQTKPSTIIGSFLRKFLVCMQFRKKRG